MGKSVDVVVGTILGVGGGERERRVVWPAPASRLCHMSVVDFPVIKFLPIYHGLYTMSRRCEAVMVLEFSDLLGTAHAFHTRSVICWYFKASCNAHSIAAGTRVMTAISHISFVDQPM